MKEIALYVEVAAVAGTFLIAVINFFALRASIRAAKAAAKSADLAALAFRSARRPSIEVDWHCFTPDGVLVELDGVIKDAADVPTTLHCATVDVVRSDGTEVKSKELVSTPMPLRKGTLALPFRSAFPLEAGERMRVTVELRVSTIEGCWENWTNDTIIGHDDRGPYVVRSHNFMERETAAAPDETEPRYGTAEALSEAWKGGLRP